MYCPHCGQERTSSETRFCSRCGFLLTGVAELLSRGGELPSADLTNQSYLQSPRRRGVKQGLFIFLLSFLIVPIVAILSMSVLMGPEPVALAAILLFVGGLLRMAYAAMFESPVPTTADQVSGQSYPGQLSGQAAVGSLPPQSTISASTYAPPAQSWRDTNDLQPRVTEGTTKLLEKDDQ